MGPDDRSVPPDWPSLPVHIASLIVALPIGAWVWMIPDRIQHSCYHRVRAVETGTTEDGDRATVVEASCRGVWPLQQLAAWVWDGDPVLARFDAGKAAACAACLGGFKTRQGWWARGLARWWAGGRTGVTQSSGAA